MKNTITIAAILVASAASYAASPSKYNLRVPTSAKLSHYSAEQKEEDPWSTSGGKYDCQTWLPATSEYRKDVPFQQNRECSQNEEREVRIYAYDSFSEQRVLKETNTERRTKKIPETQGAIGTDYSYYEVTLPHGITGVNFTQMKTTSGTSISSSLITRMKHMANNGKTALWHYGFTQPEVLPHLVGEKIDESTYYNLPTTTGMTMPFTMKAKTWTWGDDADTGRMIVYSYAGSTATTAVDTGKKDWPNVWTYRTYSGNLKSNATKVRVRGLCYRVHGSNCSAKIYNGIFLLNGDLPAPGTKVLIR